MKRRNILITLLLIAAVALMPTDAQAQNNRRVEVTKAYSPEVSAATKILAPTIVNDTTVYNPEIEYNVMRESWHTTLNAHDFNPVKASFWDKPFAQHFFVKADAGYPLASDAVLRYTMQIKRLGYLNVGVNHTGDFAPRYNIEGVKRSIANSLSMKNGVDVSGGLFLDGRLLDGYIAYDNNLFNRYAEVGEPARVDFHDARMALRFGDSFSDLKHLNFSVEAHGGYWYHALPMAVESVDAYGEANVGASATLARLFFKKNRVDVKATYDMWLGGDIYRDTRMGIDVGYARRFKVVDLEVGVGYTFDKVAGRSRASHFITPHAKVLFDLRIDAFSPYFEADTRIGQNGVAALYKRNPYIDFNAMGLEFGQMANDLSYNLSVGFKGNVQTRFAYRAYFGVNFVKDQLLFYVTPEGNFAATSADNTRLVYGAELEYVPIGGLRLGGSISGVVDNVKSLYWSNDPAYEASIFAEYTLRRWQFGISSDFVGKRHWSQVDEQGGLLAPIEHKGYIDLGAKVSFSATNSVDVFAEGVNLINAKIYDYANYYRSGIGFKVGVKIEF